MREGVTGRPDLAGRGAGQGPLLAEVLLKLRQEGGARKGEEPSARLEQRMQSLLSAPLLSPTLRSLETFPLLRGFIC